MMKKAYPKARKRVISDLKSLVYDSAKIYKDKDYLVYKKNGALKSVTFSQLETEMNKIGSAFCEMGLSEAKIAVIGQTCPEWIISYLAAVNSGAVIVPLDRELSPLEIKNFINKVGALCVVFSPALREVFESQRELFETVLYFVEISDTVDEGINFNQPLPTGFISYASLAKRGGILLENGYNKFIQSKVDTEKNCAIIFTSGTTGTSKGVMLSQKNIVAAVNSSYRMTGFVPEDVIVSVLPVHHTYEMTCGILTPILIGCTVCINDSLKNVLKNFKQFAPTGLVLVPLFITTIYKKIWDTAVKNNKEKRLKMGIKISNALLKVKIDLRKQIFKDVNAAFGGRLKKIICGGAPLGAEYVDHFRELGILLCQGYGITECAPLISVCPPNWIKSESVGLPVPGIEVYIEKQPGADYGEIVVRGDNVMIGYYEDEEATKAVLDENGWFKTGDYGYIDEDGFVYITGRKKNVIVLNNGKNVFPEEIEEYLKKIDLVCECAVVGRASDNQNVVVTAIIYPDFNKAKELGLNDEYEIGERLKADIAILNKTLPGFKQIHGIELRKSEFDKTTSHKIKRYKLD